MRYSFDFSEKSIIDGLGMTGAKNGVRFFMNFESICHRMLALAVFAMAASAGVAQTKESSPAANVPAKTTDQRASAAEKSKKDTASAAAEKARKGATNASDIQKLQEESKAQRDAMIADQEALQKQLKDATEAKRKEILATMEAQRKAFQERMNILAKQMADEARKQRQGKGSKE